MVRAELNAGKTRNVYRRAAALLAAHQGLPVTRIAGLLGVTRQSVYNWITAYGAEQEKLDFEDAPRSGRPRVWTEQLDAFVRNTLNCSPQSRGYTDEQWTARNLRDHLEFSLQKRVSGETVRQRLRCMGYVWRNNRYIFFGETVPSQQEGSVSLPPGAGGVACPTQLV
jgi:transposase